MVILLLIDNICNHALIDLTLSRFRVGLMTRLLDYMVSLSNVVADVLVLLCITGIIQVRFNRFDQVIDTYWFSYKAFLVL